MVQKWFSMYLGLPKEVYVLSFGRIMTSMGALIWPMLTLIMSNKLNMSATDIGLYMMVVSLLMVPCSLIGGKLADKYNKKYIIVSFDLISNVLYILCAFIPMTFNTLIIMTIASTLQQMQHPSFDALLAEITPYKQRERAYSLMYFAMNLGLVMAPTIGGLLFKNYLNIAFLINGLCDLSSTIMIIIFIKAKKIYEDHGDINEHEKGEGGSLWSVLLKRKTLVIFFVICMLNSALYSQFNFLLPLHLEGIYLDAGAFRFGILSSLNAMVVVIGTPIVTKYFLKLNDSTLMFIGQALEVVGLSCFMFVGVNYLIGIVSVILLTVGEIFLAISSTPHFSKRIPLTHRGRMLGLLNICVSLVGTCTNYGVGVLLDKYSYTYVWGLVAIVGIVLLLIFIIYINSDKKIYKSLYE